MTLYALYDEFGEIRYIGQISKFGKTLEQRLKEHLQPSALRKPGHKNNWLRRMVSSNLSPTIRAFQYFDSKQYLDEAERYWIAYFRSVGCRLVNDVDGGEGLINPSLETRDRMSRAKKGKSSNRLGCHLSEATKEKLRQANLGKRASTETRAKMAAADRSSHHLSEEGRAAQLASRLGWRASPEQLRHMKEASLLREEKKRARTQSSGQIKEQSNGS